MDFYLSCTHFQINLDEIGMEGCRESKINALGNHIQLNFLWLFCVSLFLFIFFIHVSTLSPSVLPSHYLQLKYSQENENKIE